MAIIGTDIKNNQDYKINLKSFKLLVSKFDDEKNILYKGGGKISIDKQHNKGRLTARERVAELIDDKSTFLEIGVFASYKMYKEYGNIPCAGLITGVGKINGLNCMIIANDATVKAGAYFELTLKKTLRAQEIARQNKLPIIYLVDSAGVFLPLQDQVFPDENHFGRIFYNNAKISAQGIPQIACVMGPCVAGGAYLPVMCDKYIIVDGASMFLAGPALVRASIGQEIDAETLGGSVTHTSKSGTADYKEKDDYAGLDRIKTVLSHINHNKNNIFIKGNSSEPKYDTSELLGIINPDSLNSYDVLEVLSRIVDESNFEEYKPDYGQTIICGHAKIGGYNVGIVGNQRTVIKKDNGTMQLGGVIYNDSADKAARFVMNCDQDKIPIIFLHDVNGFMVGKDSEWSGIAKDGAKLVNAVSNCRVPKISIVLGGSYGAGNYAMSGRAYSPHFLFAWPTAKIAVMGSDQAAETLASIKLSKVGNVTDTQKEEIVSKIKAKYRAQADIRYGAARMWVDEIINPQDTRYIIIKSLEIISNNEELDDMKYGVLQV